MNTVRSSTPSPAAAGGFTPSIDVKALFADVDKLRLPYGDTALSTIEIMSKIAVRKSTRQEWIRTCLDEQKTLITRIYEDRDTRDFYFIAPNMVQTLYALGEVTAAKLVPAVTRQGVPLVIPVKLPAEGSPMSGWHETMLTAVERGSTKWIRISADMALGGYRIYEAIGDLGEPKFPDMPLNDMLEIAFKGRIIDSEDHPVVEKLAGRV
jgi:hypothetical protein